MFGWLKKLLRREPKVQVGTLEDIALTWGSKGHQVMTISGHEYATWVDHTCWPKRGDSIKFTVFEESDGRGGIMRCAKLLENLGPKRPKQEPPMK